ncbi:MAG: nitrous oxide reductase accessory protein NosL [Actinomycetota bacterium]
MRTFMVVVLLVLLSACGKESAAPPAPAAVTPDAVAYYCQMALAEHPGPKGQIWLAGRDKPLWFAQVRDAVAFTLLPEEPKDIRAIWVTDMAHPDQWVAAEKAFYVIGSDAKGGMGLPETVPFSDRAAADAFTHEHGGRIVTFKEIPRDQVLDNPMLQQRQGG